MPWAMIAKKDVQILEQGDVFFFYRPRAGAEEVRGREDVQRFYMVLAPERPKKVYRLFVVGRKKLPEPSEGAQHPGRRGWALNVLTTEDPQDLLRELAAVEYPTETRGERFVPAATPVGEGKYLLFKHKDHTELAYALELPKEPGPAQKEFDLQKEASYVVAVKNPDIAAPGFSSPKEPPAYPERLKRTFGKHRWINIEDPALLDYKNTQILLLGAHAPDVEEELGIHIDTEDQTLATAEVCRELRLRCDRERVKPLLTGEFPEKAEERAKEVRRLSPEESPSKGGKAAARHAPSAAAIAKLLGGIDLPKSWSAIVAYARQHADRIDNPEEAIELLRHLPDRRYETMADVEAGLHEAREAVYGPAQPPRRAPSAADLEKALAGIDFPKSKSGLVAYAAGRADPEVLQAIEALPDRIYRDAAEVAKAFGEIKTLEEPRPAREAAAEEPPGRRGGRAAATEAVSAAAVAKMLGGIHFPSSKAELLAHARKNRNTVADPEGVSR